MIAWQVDDVAEWTVQEHYDFVSLPAWDLYKLAERSVYRVAQQCDILSRKHIDATIELDRCTEALLGSVDLTMRELEANRLVAMRLLDQIGTELDDHLGMLDADMPCKPEVMRLLGITEPDWDFWVHAYRESQDRISMLEGDTDEEI
jgi:hypothetical protein